ncbi:MAG: hypothetical protein HOM21_00685 [Halobacteriovoraceae bacterium]|jgi:cytoskeleton protein RodZ|nr:hypothetical protein [Halobacteriovoraceae bacterium]
MGKRKNGKAKQNEKASKPFLFSDYENEEHPEIQDDLNVAPPPSPREDLVVEEEAPEPLPSLPAEQVTIGAFLKHKREEKKLSIKIISQHTKISVTMLEFLEGDLFEKLPDKAYVKGYIKSYSRILSLNQAETLDVLDKTYEIFSDVVPQPKNLLETSNDEGNHNGVMPVIFGAVGICLALGLIAFFVFGNSNNEKTVEKVVEPTTLNADTPLKSHSEGAVQAIEKEEVVEGPVQNPAPAVAPVVEKKAAPEKATDEDDDFVAEAADEETDKKETEEQNKITFRSLTLPLFTIDKKLSDEDLQKYFPESAQRSIDKNRQNLFINAVKGDSWITYKTDENPIKKFVLKKGRTLLIRGDEIRIFLGNVNATKMFYNGKPILIQTSSGVKSLVFPEGSHGKFKIPLFVFKKDGTVDTSEAY